MVKVSVVIDGKIADVWWFDSYAAAAAFADTVALDDDLDYVEIEA